MPPPFRLYVISSESQYPKALETILPQLTQMEGVALQLREKQWSPRQQMEWLTQYQQVLRQAHPGFSCYLNDRADLALSAGLSGVQLREDSAPLESWHPLLRQGLSVGVSTHSIEGVLAAERAGADFATLSPIFPTSSKPDCTALGTELLAEAARQTTLPLFALGGVDLENMEACLKAGAYGVAVISAVWNALEPLEPIRQFTQQLLRYQLQRSLRKETHS